MDERARFELAGWKEHDLDNPVARLVLAAEHAESRYAAEYGAAKEQRDGDVED